MFEKLNSRELDILKEVSNIGAGHAATALSQLIGRRINLEVPEVVLEDISKVAQIAGGADALVAGLYFQILGDARGNIFMIFPAASARAIVALATGQEELTELRDEMSVSAIKEVGNILASAFLSAIGQLTGLTLIPSVPLLPCGHVHPLARRPEETRIRDSARRNPQRRRRFPAQFEPDRCRPGLPRRDPADAVDRGDHRCLGR